MFSSCRPVGWDLGLPDPQSVASCHKQPCLCAGCTNSIIFCVPHMKNVGKPWKAKHQDGAWPSVSFKPEAAVVTDKWRGDCRSSCDGSESISGNHWQKRISLHSSFKKTLLDALLVSSLWPYRGHDLPSPTPAIWEILGKRMGKTMSRAHALWPELKVESKNMSCYRTPIVAVSIVILKLSTNLSPKKFLELCSSVSCWEDTAWFLVWHMVKVWSWSFSLPVHRLRAWS